MRSIVIDMTFEGEREGLHVDCEPAEMGTEEMVTLMVLVMYRKTRDVFPNMTRTETSEYLTGIIEAVCKSEDREDMKAASYVMKH